MLSRASFAIEVVKACDHAAEDIRGTIRLRCHRSAAVVTGYFGTPATGSSWSPARLQVDTTEIGRPRGPRCRNPEHHRGGGNGPATDGTGHPCAGANTDSYIPASADAVQYLQAVAIL